MSISGEICPTNLIASLWSPHPHPHTDQSHQTGGVQSHQTGLVVFFPHPFLNPALASSMPLWPSVTTCPGRWECLASGQQVGPWSTSRPSVMHSAFWALVKAREQVSEEWSWVTLLLSGGHRRVSSLCVCSSFPTKLEKEGKINIQ